MPKITSAPTQHYDVLYERDDPSANELLTAKIKELSDQLELLTVSKKEEVIAVKMELLELRRGELTVLKLEKQALQYQLRDLQAAFAKKQKELENALKLNPSVSTLQKEPQITPTQLLIDHEGLKKKNETLEIEVINSRAQIQSLTRQVEILEVTLLGSRVFNEAMEDLRAKLAESEALCDSYYRNMMDLEQQNLARQGWLDFYSNQCTQLSTEKQALVEELERRDCESASNAELTALLNRRLAAAETQLETIQRQQRIPPRIQIASLRDQVVFVTRERDSARQALTQLTASLVQQGASVATSPYAMFATSSLPQYHGGVQVVSRQQAHPTYRR